MLVCLDLYAATVSDTSCPKSAMMGSILPAPQMMISSIENGWMNIRLWQKSIKIEADCQFWNKFSIQRAVSCNLFSSRWDTYSMTQCEMVAAVLNFTRDWATRCTRQRWLLRAGMCKEKYNGGLRGSSLRGLCWKTSHFSKFRRMTIGLGFKPARVRPARCLWLTKAATNNVSRVKNVQFYILSKFCGGHFIVCCCCCSGAMINVKLLTQE